MPIVYGSNNWVDYHLMASEFPEFFNHSTFLRLSDHPNIDLAIRSLAIYFGSIELIDVRAYLAIANTINFIRTDPYVETHPVTPDMCLSDRVARVHMFPFSYPELLPWHRWYNMDKYGNTHTGTYDRAMLHELIEPYGYYVDENKRFHAAMAMVYALEKELPGQKITTAYIKDMVSRYRAEYQLSYLNRTLAAEG